MSQLEKDQQQIIIHLLRMTDAYHEINMLLIKAMGGMAEISLKINETAKEKESQRP